MTAIEIEQIVHAEIILNQQNFRYWKVADIESCLMKSYQELCVSQYPEQFFDVWVVFEEQPSKQLGYVIAFDEETAENPFVLANWNREKTALGYIHHSATFFEALEGM
jgi:hypothetical protein